MEITYLRITDGNYITGLQTIVDNKKEVKDSDTVKVINKEQFEYLLKVFNSRPHAEQGYAYGLKTDLTWEKYELPVIPEEIQEEVDNAQ